MKKFDIPVAIDVICPFCGKEHEVIVEFENLLDYQAGMLVQDAFPYLSPDEREALISGLCPDCCKKIFVEY